MKDKKGKRQGGAPGRGCGVGVRTWCNIHHREPGYDTKIWQQMCVLPSHIQSDSLTACSQSGCLTVHKS